MILQEEIRNSLGIDLRGNILIFDEAHNLEEVNQFFQWASAQQ